MPSGYLIYSGDLGRPQQFTMGIETVGRQNRARGSSACKTLPFFTLALAMLLGAAWAKASRYDLRAAPSPYFSKSVKIARILFVNGLGELPFALSAASPRLHGPDWSGLAPLPAQFTAHGAAPLPFQRFRAPPTAV